MEIREWALQILSSERLKDKLFAPACLEDNSPGPALFWQEPARSPDMQLRRRSRQEKLPAFQEHYQQDKRAACLHRFAGHELLAVEIMAFALLAFPEAPPRFRKGLANTLKEEQEHVRLYMARMEQLGIAFGDLPLYRHFWMHTPHITSPLHYVSVMSLTFEQANLDFAPIYGKSFAAHGDELSAALMARILSDEIAHVSFGLNWLKRMKDSTESDWEAWERTLATTLLEPKRGKGFYLHPQNRIEAGLSNEWIQQLEKA